MQRRQLLLAKMWMLATFTFLPPDARADCVDYAAYLRVVGSIPLAEASAIVAAGSEAYVGSDGLHRIDVSDPGSPRVVALQPGRFVAVDVDMTRTVVYAIDVASPPQVRTFDASQPGALVPAGAMPLYNANTCVLRGNRLFVGGLGYLAVVDVSDPRHPILTTSLPTPSGILSLDVAGDYAELGSADSGLLVVDIADPDNPQMAAQLPIDDRIVGLSYEPPYAYLGAFSAGFHIVDLRVPTNPVLVGRFTTYPIPYRVVANQGLAFAADGLGALTVLDVRTPWAPEDIGRIHVPCDVRGIAVAGSHVYVVGAQGIVGGRGGFHVIDATNPSSAPQASPVAALPPLHTGLVSDRIGYMLGTDDDGSLVVLDLGDPMVPQVLATLPGTHGTDIDLGTGRAYVISYQTDGRYLLVIDISSPSHPELESSAPVQALSPRALAVGGTRAAVAAGDAGLLIFDLPEDGSPVLVATIPMKGEAVDVDLAGSLAIMCCDPFGIEIVDIENVARGVVGSLPMDRPYSVTVNGSQAYVGTHAGLDLISISDPERPAFLSHVDIPPLALSVAVANEMAYVANGNGGFQVIDVRNISSPVVIGGSALRMNWVASVALVDDDVVLAGTRLSGNAGAIHVLPTQCAPTPLAASAFRAEIEGRAVRLSWVSWPERSPYGFRVQRSVARDFGYEEVARTPRESRSPHVLRDESVAAATTYYYRLSKAEGPHRDTVLAINSVTTPFWTQPRATLERPSPSPFRRATQIVFSTPAEGFVRLRIHDVAGRLVRTLEHRTFEGGSHKSWWDGRGEDGVHAAAGVYLVRLEVAGQATTQRAVYLGEK